MSNAPKVSDRLSYEDRANPRRVGTVTEVIESKWGTEFRIAFDDGSSTISDCRQAGWKPVAS